MNHWTLLTIPEWAGICPSMPGRYGPSYGEQTRVIEAWGKAEAGGQWRLCHHEIFRLYRQAMADLDAKAQANRQESAA